MENFVLATGKNSLATFVPRLPGKALMIVNFGPNTVGELRA